MCSRSPVDVDGDALGAQPVGERHRQVAGDDGLLDPPPPERSNRRLELRLVGRHPLGDQVVEPELGRREHLRARQLASDPLGLERVGHDERLIVPHDEQERIHDLDRHLVPHVGVRE